MPQPAAGATEPGGRGRGPARINAVSSRSSASPIGKRDPGAPLSIDNLRGLEASGERPKVTVIMPLWNAEATVPTEAARLAEQTRDQALVVDDE